MNAGKLLSQVAKGVEKNADIVMTVGALVGLVCTVVLAVKETPAALDIIDDGNYYTDRVNEMERQHDISPEEAEIKRRDIKIDTAKKLAINYAPAVGSMVLTGGSMIGVTRWSRSKNAALTGLLNASNLALTEYRDHVREAIGNKKETAIYDQVRKEHLENNPPPPPNDILDTGNGSTLCYIETYPGDPKTGIYFYSSRNAIDRAINRINADAINNGIASMDDLLYEFGLRLPFNGTRFIGWQMQGSRTLIDPRYTSHIHDKTGLPVLDIGFWNNPTEKFGDWG